MKILNIINRYIFKELMLTFAISLFFLTFVFLMSRIPEITNKIVNYNANISSVFLLIAYMLPRFMEFTIPMSVMTAVLLTFMRMSGEKELIALKGAGISLYRLLVPVLIFSSLGVIVTLYFTVVAIPQGRLALKKETIALARSSMDIAFQERQFNSQVKNIMMYISHIDLQTKTMKDIFIEDRRTAGVVSISLAPLGELIKSDEAVYTLRLYNGLINQVDSAGASVNTIHFGSYDINIDLSEVVSGKKQIHKKLNEQSFSELINIIRSETGNNKHLRSALMQLHEKFAIPFACLVLGILAFPLGIQSNFQQKSSGVALGVLFFLIYYLLLAMGWSVGETGKVWPAIALWTPNIIIGGLGVFFLIRNAQEKPIEIPIFLVKLFSKIQILIQRKI
jgi:lipopolysaccharide export system permease protein